jgi:hypothetical protein
MRQMKCFCGVLLEGEHTVDNVARRHLAEAHGLKHASQELIDYLRSERALHCSACDYRVADRDRYLLINQYWEHIQKSHPGELDWDEDTLARILNEAFGKYGRYEGGVDWRDLDDDE